MTTLRERIDEIDERMRETKELWVAENPENPELAIYLYFWRDEDVVACIQTPLDRDMALPVSVMGAAGFNATTMACTFESWISELKESPLTGKEWRRGEMNFVARNYPDAAEKGWVTEVLSTSIHDREGKYYLSSQPFKTMDGDVLWDKRRVIPEEGEEDISGSGVMYGAFQHAMSQPTMLERMAEMSAKDPVMGASLFAAENMLSVERQLFHCDVATLAALEEKELVSGLALFADPDSERAKLIEERAEELGMTAGE